MKTIAYKTLSHCIYKYQIHLRGQTFVWAPIEHYSPSQVNIAESAVLCKGIEPPSTEPLAYTLFVIVILWHTWVEDSLYLYCLVLLPFFFFFNYSPSYKVLGADCGLNVWGVLAELLGVSWTVVMLGGTAWQPSGKALLKIHCWESNWASAWSKTWTHTHQHTLRRLVRKMNACGRGASKPGIMTFLPSFIISDTTSLSFRLLTSASFHKDQTHG